jgi:ADP-heptose:LPS heptosyltransferase
MIRGPKYFKRYLTEEGPDNFKFWLKLAQKDSIRVNNKVCVILRPDAVGDYVLYMPYLSGLRTLYPEHRFLFIGTAEVCHLAQASNIIDHCLVWDRCQYEQRNAYWRQWLKKLSEITADILIYPCYSREANADEMVAVLKANEKIGIRGDDCNIDAETARYNERFYTKIVDIKSGNYHESVRNRSFLNKIGGTPGASLPLWKIEDMDLVSGFLSDKQFPMPYLVVAPGASVAHKCWPIDKFHHIIEFFLYRSSGSVLIMGGANEAPLANRLKAMSSFPDRIALLTGSSSLRQSAAFISKASLFIGNDSGLAHIAGNLGIVGHVVVGGAHFGRFFPNPETPNINVYTHPMSCFGCNWRCSQKMAHCIVDADLDMDSLIQDLGNLT